MIDNNVESEIANLNTFLEKDDNINKYKIGFGSHTSAYRHIITLYKNATGKKDVFEPPHKILKEGVKKYTNKDDIISYVTSIENNLEAEFEGLISDYIGYKSYGKSVIEGYYKKLKFFLEEAILLTKVNSLFNEILKTHFDKYHETHKDVKDVKDVNEFRELIFENVDDTIRNILETITESDEEKNRQEFITKFTSDETKEKIDQIVKNTIIEKTSPKSRSSSKIEFLDQKLNPKKISINNFFKSLPSTEGGKRRRKSKTRKSKARKSKTRRTRRRRRSRR